MDKIRKPRNFKKINLTYSEEQIVEWVKRIKNEKVLLTLYTTQQNRGGIYTNENTFIASICWKLDVRSKNLFIYYYNKFVKNQKYECKNPKCSNKISKEFFVTKYKLKREPILWCEDCYKNKAWMGILVKKAHTPEANAKRTQSKLKFYQTPEGKALAKKIGKNNSITTKNWKANLTEEESFNIRKKSSESQIKNIKEGKFNPQKNYNCFKNNICYINGKEYSFRSSWEVIFFISNPNLKYESLRIEYNKDTHKKGIYIPDFIDEENKIVYELKPRRNYIKQQIKMDGGIKWCLENGYTFIWVNENTLQHYINEEDNKDPRNVVFYNKAYKGIDGEIKNQINKKNRAYTKSV